MIKNRFIQTALVATLVLGTISCKDQLDIGNPNSPSAIPASEAAILQLATGGVYINGFLNGDGWLGNSYFSLPMGYNELLADNVGASASNNQVTTIAQPAWIQLDDGTKRFNTSPTTGIIRTYNTRASTGGGNNALHYQWLNMYAMNNAMNLVLSLVEDIPYALDAESKIKTIQAWAYFWKGFAYASIGTKYYAGLIVNTYGETSSTYVSHDAMIAESNKYFNLAATTLDGMPNEDAYNDTFSALIPDQNEAGHGGSLSIDEWKKNINTLLARNILFNKLAPFVNNSTAATITGSSMTSSMTTADWTAVQTLTENGIQEGDLILVGYTTGTNDFFSAGGGTVAALTTNPASTSTFKPSERAIQNFKAGDKRFTNNFTAVSPYSNDYVYGVRYTMSNGGKSVAPAAGDNPPIVYGNREPGEQELVIAGSYEENALMLAEANIRLGDIKGGLDLIDEVRDYLGAGIAHVSAPIPTQTQAEALRELTMERRVALLYRGLSFYDNRRWGWTYDITKGGGSYENVIIIGNQQNLHAIINYSFMDYWDVPANEIVLNPADGTSVPTQNPNF